MKPAKSPWFIIFCLLTIGVILYATFIRPLQIKYYQHHVDIHGLYLLNPIDIDHFDLVDQYGKSFTKKQLLNHWSLLFFGFTNCDMVCPVTLTALRQFYQNIQPKLSSNEKPQIIFITIDPERDTTERLKSYLASFNRDFMGARTSLENTKKIENQFHIISEKNPSRPDQYNHSADLLLINPNAKIQAYFYFPHNPLQLEKDYLRILDKEKSLTR